MIPINGRPRLPLGQSRSQFLFNDCFQLVSSPLIPVLCRVFCGMPQCSYCWIYSQLRRSHYLKIEWLKLVFFVFSYETNQIRFCACLYFKKYGCLKNWYSVSYSYNFSCFFWFYLQSRGIRKFKSHFFQNLR